MGRYGALLSSGPGLQSSLKSATEALCRISEKIWIDIPTDIQGDKDEIESFVNQVNIQQCVSFMTTVRENYDELNFSSGGIRGMLMSPITGFNFWMLYHLVRDSKGLYKMAKELYAIKSSRFK